MKTHRARHAFGPRNHRPQHPPPGRGGWGIGGWGMGGSGPDTRLGNRGGLEELGLGSTGNGELDTSWLDELLEVAPLDQEAPGAWSGVQDDLAQVSDGVSDGGTEQAAPTKEDLGIGTSGRGELDRLATAGSRPWYSSPRGKCYAAVAGYSSEAYMNRAGGRWKQLADRIPGSHAMWAVSFAHWLQETSHGQRAASELGFEIVESDGETRLSDYLKARPELKGAIVVIPHGQEGTASREWNAAANYGDAKWGGGVGDISVVTEISGRGVTYVADAVNPHDSATMWWVVYPK